MSLFPSRRIGLAITDHGIEAVVLAHHHVRPQLVGYGHASLPAGLVSHGVVLRPAEVALILRKLLADQMHPALPRGVRHVALALPEGQVFSHVFEVPTASDEAALTRAMVREAETHFPYRSHELVTGQTVIAMNHASKQVYFAAVPKAALTSQMELCAAAGLELVSVEGEASAAARALFRKDEPGTSLLVDVGEHSVTLAAFDRHGIHFSQTLPPPAPGHLATDVHRAMKAFEAEAERTVRRIFLSGEAALAPGVHDGFVEAVADSAVEVHMADPFDNVSISSKLEPLGLRPRGVLLVAAIGLGLRAGGAHRFPSINFLLQADRPSRRRAVAGHLKRLSWSQQMALVACAVLIVALATWFLAFKALPAIWQPPQTPAPAAAPIDRTVSMTFMLGPDASGEGSLTAVPLDAAVDIEQTFPHASATALGHASGTIRIINDQPTKQALIATTRFMSSGGLVFRLANAVTVPAHGTVQATIVADQIGASGDLPPGRFSIPGLPSAKQSKIYGQSDASFTGGQVSTGSPFTQEDLSAAEAAISTKAASLLADRIRAAAGDRVILDALVAQTGMSVVSGPRLGEPTGSYVLQVRVTARGLAFSAGAVVQALARRAQAQNIAGSAPIVGTVRYAVTHADIPAGKATLQASAEIQ